VEASSRERLTGAVIFVTVFSIVASEMFSGRGEDALVQEQAAPAEAGPPLTTYELALNPSAAPAAARGQDVAASTATATITQALPPPAGQEPAAAPPPPAPVAQPAPATAPQAATAATSKPEQAAPKAATTAPAGAGWWVQLGSFSSAENAQRLARDLRARGFAVEVTPVKVRGKDLLGVRAGPVGDRDAAAALKNRIGPSARDAILVAPSP
jgi:DedD protein